MRYVMLGLLVLLLLGMSLGPVGLVIGVLLPALYWLHKNKRRLVRRSEVQQPISPMPPRNHTRTVNTADSTTAGQGVSVSQSNHLSDNQLANQSSSNQPVGNPTTASTTTITTSTVRGETAVGQPISVVHLVDLPEPLGADVLALSVPSLTLRTSERAYLLASAGWLAPAALGMTGMGSATIKSRGSWVLTQQRIAFVPSMAAPTLSMAWRDVVGLRLDAQKRLIVCVAADREWGFVLDEASDWQAWLDVMNTLHRVATQTHTLASESSTDPARASEQGTTQPAQSVMGAMATVGADRVIGSAGQAHATQSTPTAAPIRAQGPFPATHTPQQHSPAKSTTLTALGAAAGLCVTDVLADFVDGDFSPMSVGSEITEAVQSTIHDTLGSLPQIDGEGMLNNAAESILASVENLAKDFVRDMGREVKDMLDGNDSDDDWDDGDDDWGDDDE